MKAGQMDRKASFYAKVKSSDTDFGGTTDTWPTVTLTVSAQVVNKGGGYSLSDHEKFYSTTLTIKVRYRVEILETMRVKLSNFPNVLFEITNIDELGRKEGLSISLQKINE
jgi:head-tail adaptor